MNLLLTSVLVAIWGGLSGLDQSGPHLGFRKPLLASIGVGLILGDLKTAIIIGATLELMWLGVNNIGAYIPPDVITGTVVGAAIGIASGTDIETSVATAIAVAVPVAMLAQQIIMFVMTGNIAILHRADKAATSGDFKTLDKYHYLGGLMFFLARAVPIFLAVYFGSAFIDQILAAIPVSVLDGFRVASGIIPGVGLAMLLTMMLKKNMWIFLLLGFVSVAYLKLPLFAVALVGAAVAGFYDIVVEGISNNANVVAEDGSAEGEYDL